MEFLLSAGLALIAVLAILLLVFIAFCVHIYILHCKYNHLPGPKRVSFFLGHIPVIRHEIKGGGDLVTIFHKWSFEYDGVFLFWMFWKPSVVVYDKDSIKDVMIKYNLPKSMSTQIDLADLFGVRFVKNGLVTISNQDEWKKKRNAANPAFYRSHLKTLISDYNNSCDKFLNKISEMADGKTPVRMLDYFHRVTLDVIGKVGFDIQFDSVENDQTPFPKAVANCLKGIMFIFRNPLYKFTPTSWKFQREVADGARLLRETGRKCIETRQAALSRGEPMQRDILSTIMKFTELQGCTEDLLDDFVTFFVAGQETTANQLSFLLLEVTQRPNVMEKLRTEIKEVLGSRDNVEFDDLAKLQYMGQVLKETLRVYPPVTFIDRETKDQIDLHGHQIPANTKVVVSIYNAHHSPENFEEPEKFDPDRWSQENAKNIDRFSYLPFSLGPRNCIGQVFAQFESKVLLARFLKDFDVTLCPGQTRAIRQLLTLQPKDGVMCTLQKRQDYKS